MRYDRRWVEIFFVLFVFLGLYLALSSGDLMTTYIVIMVCGFLSGRIVYRKQGIFRFAYILIIIGFLIGYMIGSFYGSKLMIIFLFLVTSIAGFQLHKRKIL